MTKVRDERFDCLRLENQICFPLYVCSKEVIRRYKPFLDELELTYTQYITMMALWELNECSEKELGKMLYLDSGTLTPLLKKLEAKGYLTRSRAREDERVLTIVLTEEGRKLEERALTIPKNMAACLRLDPEDALSLYQLLHKLLDGINE